MTHQLKPSRFAMLASIAFSLAWVGLVTAGDKIEKNVTHVVTTSSADGKSDIRKEVLEECFLSLPNPNSLEAVVETQTSYLKGINGEKGKNAHTKTYTATLEINYILYQKELIIVTTSSVQGQEPVLKEVERKLKQTKSFVSNSSEGDIYAGRSDRQYYFSTEAGAVNDVKKRATAWLKQQSGGACRDK